jgi:hypothetical protein
MDDVRIKRVDAPDARPRRRWPVALVACVVAAPLMSGSATALTGGSDDSAAPSIKPAVSTFSAEKRDGHKCRKGERGRGSTTYQY